MRCWGCYLTNTMSSCKTSSRNSELYIRLDYPIFLSFYVLPRLLFWKERTSTVSSRKEIYYMKCWNCYKKEVKLYPKCDYLPYVILCSKCSNYVNVLFNKIIQIYSPTFNVYSAHSFDVDMLFARALIKLIRYKYSI